MRKSIYLNPTTAAILDADDEPNLSGRIAGIAAAWAMACDNGGLERAELDSLPSAMVRYRALLDEAAPMLSENEWSLLCDVLNGCVLTAEHADLDPAQHLGRSVSDSAPDGMGDKWGVDIAALAGRIERMPYAGRCAIVETVARFWRQAGSSMSSIGEQLRAAGARVAAGE